MQNYEQTKIETFPQPAPDSRDLNTLPPSPDNPPWGGGIAFLMWLASVLFIFIVPGMAIAIYGLVQQPYYPDAQSLLEHLQSDPNVILVNLLAVLPAHILTLVLAWVVITKIDVYSFHKMLGWRLGGFKFWHLLVIVVSFFSLAALLIKFFGDPENDLTKILKSSDFAVYIVAFLATFTAPLIEEVIYRGVLYSGLQKDLKDLLPKYHTAVAVIIVTALFAAVHVPQYWGSTATLIMIGLLSLTLTLIRVKTGNLLPCIILHTTLNGIQSLFLVLGTFAKDLPADSSNQAFSFLHLFR